MASSAELQIVISGQDKTSQVLKGIKNEAGGLGKTLADIGKTAAGVALGVGITQAPQIIGGLIGAASNMNETLSKSNTIFGDQAKVIEDWASGAAKDFGQSKEEALGAAAGFGNMFDQLGIGSDVAADMSMGIVELASDFASFNNVGTEEVLNAQSAAFRGEYDSLQKFLPLINAATVEQRALEMTGKASNKELTAQEKALAVNALMFEGAGEAMGDFDKTAGSLANQQKTLGAEFANIQAQIGQQLLPVMVALAGFALNTLIPAITNLAGVIGSAIGPAVSSAAGAISGLISAFKGGSSAVGSFGGKAAALSGPLGAVANIIRTVVPQALAFMQEKFAALKGYFESDVKPALDNIGVAVMAVVGVIQQNWPLIQAVIQPIMEQVLLTIETVVNSIMLIFGILIDLIGGDFSGAWQKLQELIGVVWEGIKGTIGNAVEIITGVLALAWEGIQAGAALAWEGIKALVAAAWEEIKASVSNGVNAIPGIIYGLAGAASQAASDFAQSIFNSIMNWLNQLPGRVFGIVQQVMSQLNPLQQASNVLGIDVNPFNYEGTPYWRGGMTWVGEQGPELVNLPRGSAIYSAPKSQQMAEEMNQGGGVTVNVMGNVVIEDVRKDTGPIGDMGWGILAAARQRGMAL